MPDSISTPNDLRSQKVDLLSTKNIDMKRRRVINAGPAEDKNDYVVLDQLNAAVDQVEGELADTNHSLEQTILSILVNRAKYGTHALKLSIAANLVDTAIFVETDRTNVVYQSQKVAGASQWVYVTGTMRGTISPDNRPTDLGTNDTGFLYQATDFNGLYRWFGSGWITNQQSPIAGPVGGSVIDVQSRSAINDIIIKLRSFGITT